MVSFPKGADLKGVFTIIVLISLLRPFALVSQAKTVPDTLKPQSSVVPGPVSYSARDSIRVDLEKKHIILYGKGKVTYEAITVTAAYIMIDMETGSIVAAGTDSAGKIIDRPNLEEDERETTADSIKYNFKSRKGWMYRVVTSEGEAFMYADAGKKDSSEVYFIKNGKYTTCDADHPHFYINVTRGKVIPDDKIVTGPAYLVIGDIPTPLALPFGYFPNKKGRKSGILLPAYGESPGLGFFLKDGGVYFGISDYFDLAVKGDIYSRGSFGVKTFSNYNRRYAYQGNLALGFSNFRNSYPEFPDFSKNQDFFIRWTHTQDPKRNPTVRFSANVNALSSNYNKFNSNNTNDYLSNTFQSNLAFTKTWKHFNLNSGLSHSQNTTTRKVDLSLPRLSFSMNRQQPFSLLNRSGISRNKWYDKIGISYTGDFENRISIADSNFFKSNLSDSMRYAFRHAVPLLANFSFKKIPVVLTPAFTFNSLWYFRKTDKTYSSAEGGVVATESNEFNMVNHWNSSITGATKVYGMYSFNRGRVKAIRHVMNPTIGFSYRPDYEDPRFGYYGSYLLPTTTAEQVYSHFEGGLFGSAPRGKSASLNFGLNNNLEMKLRPGKSDTTGKDRKVVLIESFGFNGSYNYAVEAFNFSPLSLYARSRIWDKVDINLTGLIDPYKITESGFRYNQLLWSDGNPGRLTAATATVGTGFSSKQKGKKGKPLRSSEEEYEYIQKNPGYYVDFNVPWNFRLAYNLVYSRPVHKETLNHTLTISGDFNLTDKWKIGGDSGYDLTQGDFTFTNISIYRDLHCWEMQFNWIPYGFRKSYTIDIRVKASVLQDLKLSRKRDWFDFN